MLSFLEQYIRRAIAPFPNRSSERGDVVSVSLARVKAGGPRGGPDAHPPARRPGADRHDHGQLPQRVGDGTFRYDYLGPSRLLNRSYPNGTRLTMLNDPTSPEVPGYDDARRVARLSPSP